MRSSAKWLATMKTVGSEPLCYVEIMKSSIYVILAKAAKWESIRSGGDLVESTDSDDAGNKDWWEKEDKRMKMEKWSVE